MIGIDFGTRSLLTGVDGKGKVVIVPGPKPLRSALRRLRRLSRRHSRRHPGSVRRRKSAAQLARVHARVAYVRADALHKATSMLAAQYEMIIAEDLNVAGMAGNRSLARAVCDQGFGLARRMLGYKTAWCGGRLILANRFYPSSKTCSACGWRKPSLKLSERAFRCECCGLVLNRDLNAAMNLLSLGTASGAGTGPIGANAWGVDGSGHRHAATVKLFTANREPGTAFMGETGTASRQLPAAGHVSTKTH